jgi:hypothetical protein
MTSESTHSTRVIFQENLRWLLSWDLINKNSIMVAKLFIIIIIMELIALLFLFKSLQLY